MDVGVGPMTKYMFCTECYSVIYKVANLSTFIHPSMNLPLEALQRTQESLPRAPAS